MKETYDYRGHSIDLDLSDIVRAHRWTDFIDGRYCIQGAAASSPIEAVRRSALALAHRSIDVLDSMHPAKGVAGNAGHMNRVRSWVDGARFVAPDGAPLARLHGLRRIT